MVISGCGSSPVEEVKIDPKKYRIMEKKGMFYPQYKMWFFWWNYVDDDEYYYVSYKFFSDAVKYIKEDIQKKKSEKEYQEIKYHYFGGSNG